MLQITSDSGKRGCRSCVNDTPTRTGTRARTRARGRTMTRVCARANALTNTKRHSHTTDRSNLPPQSTRCSCVVLSDHLISARKLSGAHGAALGSCGVSVVVSVADRGGVGALLRICCAQCRTQETNSRSQSQCAESRSAPSSVSPSNDEQTKKTRRLTTICSNSWWSPVFTVT